MGLTDQSQLKNQGFVCPECKGQLQLESQGYNCGDCGRNWELKNEVPIFLPDEVPYWNDLSVEDANKLNRQAESLGYEKAVRSFCRPSLQEYILGEGKVNWKYLIEADKINRVLDIGCGWGMFSFALARSGRPVYAFEPAWQRVEFVKIRKNQQ